MNLNLGYTQLIIEKAKEHKVSVQRLAYILATAYWETARTMKPVKEAFWLSEDWRKKNLKYYPWYGRGFVQLTWDYNYKKASQKLGIDFIKNPDAVMDPKNSAEILVVGSLEGWFTGKSIFDYIDDVDESDVEDMKEYQAARRVINGVDKAVEIAKLALEYEKDLKTSGYVWNAPEKPIIVPTEPFVKIDTVTPKTPETSPTTLLELIIAILKKVFK